MAVLEGNKMQCFFPRLLKEALRSYFRCLGGLGGGWVELEKKKVSELTCGFPPQP